MIGDKIKSQMIANRLLTDVDDILLERYKLPEGCIDIGLFETAFDAVGYCAADDATKQANVEVTTIYSTYGGVGSCNNGHAFGVLTGPTVSDVERGLRYVRQYVENADGIVSISEDDSQWIYTDCISKIGKYFAKEFDLPMGSSIAFLMAPSLYGTYGLDAALTDAHVEVVKFWDAPRESNLIGAIVTGTQSQCKTACAAFERGVMEVVEEPNEY